MSVDVAAGAASVTNMDRARGLLQFAIGWLGAMHPIQASFLASCRMTRKMSGPLALGFEAGRFCLHYCPDSVTAMRFGELIGLLNHVALHVLRGHVMMSPDDYPDDNALAAALEITCNEEIQEPLPGAPVTLAQFPDLPEGEDAEARYHRLALVSDVAAVPTLDDHALWGEITADIESARLVLIEELENMRALVGDRPFDARALANRSLDVWDTDTDSIDFGRGIEAANGSTSLERVDGKAQINWHALLRRYAGRILDRASSYSRPPRRYPHLLGIVPGRTRRSAKPRIMAVIDTSGSLTKRLLSEISNELRHMARAREIVVVECDAKIQDVYPYRGPISRVAGRGGTDLRPPLEAQFLRAQRADLVVYFTDGEGPTPKRPPRVPVVWVLMPGGRRPADWGRALWMGRRTPSRS